MPLPFVNPLNRPAGRVTPLLARLASIEAGERHKNLRAANQGIGQSVSRAASRRLQTGDTLARLQAAAEQQRRRESAAGMRQLMQHLSERTLQKADIEGRKDVATIQADAREPDIPDPGTEIPDDEAIFFQDFRAELGALAKARAEAEIIDTDGSRVAAIDASIVELVKKTTAGMDSPAGKRLMGRYVLKYGAGENVVETSAAESESEAGSASEAAEGGSRSRRVASMGTSGSPFELGDRVGDAIGRLLGFDQAPSFGPETGVPSLAAESTPTLERPVQSRPDRGRVLAAIKAEARNRANTVDPIAPPPMASNGVLEAIKGEARIRPGADGLAALLGEYGRWQGRRPTSRPVTTAPGVGRRLSPEERLNAELLRLLGQPPYR